MKRYRFEVKEYGIKGGVLARNFLQAQFILDSIDWKPIRRTKNFIEGPSVILKKKGKHI